MESWKKSNSGWRKGNDKNDTYHQRRHQDLLTNKLASDDAKLAERVEFRMTTLNWRRMELLFQHCHQQFGWQIRSDMYRDLIQRGIAHAEAQVRNPTNEMLDAAANSAMMDICTRLTERHIFLDQEIAHTDDAIRLLMGAGDLGAIRETLNDFKRHTSKIKDPVIRARMTEEFDRRWGRLWQELNKGASLTSFEGE